MEIHGGRAGYNSVSFTGDKYQSLSRFKDGKIITEIRMKKENKKVIVILSKIPFVRSFSMLFEIIIESWKRFLLTVIFLLLVEFLLVGKSNSYLLHTMPINTLEMLLGLLVIASLIIKTTNLGGYHSAEHMTASAYERNQSLSLEQVKKQPRTHKDCGTNLVISFFICFSILFMIFGDTVWIFLISWSVGYEVWKIEPKIIWDVVLVIGKAAQYLFFTSKPKDRHLLVAMEAIKWLEEKELADK